MKDGQLRFDPDDLKRLITVETKLVVVNFPHNPTGAFLLRAFCCLGLLKQEASLD